MKEDTFRNELNFNGYSKEEQYFYEVDRRLKTKLGKRQASLAVSSKSPSTNKTRNNEINERSIERWETDGGELKKKL